MNVNIAETKSVQKVFSRIGFSLCVMLVVSSVFQALWFMVPGLTDNSWMMWIGTFVPIYGIGFPCCLLMLKKLPAEAPEEQKLGVKQFMTFLLVGFFLMYAGNLIGNILSAVLSGGTAENNLLNYAMDNHPLKILFLVILAPLIEEYVFRKQIIDRTAKYGEKTAVLLSALTFGLFHLNLFQFFYAFGLGLIFAYIYTRTGRLRYPVILHCIINFLGSVVAPLILSMLDLEALASMDVNAAPEELMVLYSDMLPGLMAYMLYVLLMLGLSVAGLVLLIVKRRKIVWKTKDTQLSKGFVAKTVYCNAGMVVFAVICLIMMVVSLL